MNTSEALVWIWVFMWHWAGERCSGGMLCTQIRSAINQECFDESRAGMQNASESNGNLPEYIQVPGATRSGFILPDPSSGPQELKSAMLLGFTIGACRL